MTRAADLALKSDELKALGNVWTAEVENRLPFQSKAAIYSQLQENGLLDFGSELRETVKVSGWYLTHLGRYEYCKAC